MFKLIFKFMTIVIFLVFLVIGLSLWKGGEPFRIFGEGLVAVGHEFKKFGDFVDDVVKGSNVVKETIDKIQNANDSAEEK
jgi:hypothetical protein